MRERENYSDGGERGGGERCNLEASKAHPGFWQVADLLAPAVAVQQKAAWIIE